MFENVEGKNKQNNNSPTGQKEEKEMTDSPFKPKNSSTGSDDKEQSKQQKEKQEQKSNAKDTSSSIGEKPGKSAQAGKAEDIFEGVETGEPPQQQEEVKSGAEPSSSGTGFFNKAMIKFLVFVTLTAIIILGGAYWISEWMISSM